MITWRAGRCVLIIEAFALIGSGPVVASGSEEQTLAAFNWANPNEVVVAQREMVFTSRALPSTKNESLYVHAYSADGSAVLFCLFHIESPIVNRWGSYVLVVDPQGVVHWGSGRIPVRSVTHSESELDVRNDTTSFVFTGDSYQLRHRADGIDLDLSITSSMPPWKAGTGRFELSDDGSLYLDRILVSPRADFRGTITAGESFEFVGTGTLEKTRFSNPLSRFGPYFHSMRVLNGDYSLYLHSVTLCDEYGGKQVSVLGLAQGSRWLVTSPEFEFHVEQHQATESMDYPSSIRIGMESNGYRIDGVYEEIRFIGFTDVFGELPVIARGIAARLFSRPMYARSIGRFTGTLTGPDGIPELLILEGPYEYAEVR